MGGVFRWVLRALASMALEEERLYFFQSALRYVSVFSLGVSFGLCFVICGFRRGIWICLLFGSASALVSPGWCCVLLSCCLCRLSSVCVDLDLCSLLRCVVFGVGGVRCWWCSVLVVFGLGRLVWHHCGWVGIFAVPAFIAKLAVGSISSHFTIHPLLFPLLFLAFSIVSQMSCFVNWPFLGVPDIVIFVSCPLSSMMMVVLCLVCILHFSPPFPVTLPVYSLLIDIVVVLSCSRCLVWWWLVGGCLSSGVCAVLWVVCGVPSEHSAFQFLGNYMYFGSWCEVYVVFRQ